MTIRIGLMLGALALPLAAAQAQMSREAVAVVQQPVEVEREGAVARIPLTSHMGKLALMAKIDGVERQFILDTGSPTLISRELAAQLGLTPIGSNTGRDANGQEHTTEVALVEELTIGGVTFRNVPVLISDFGASDPDRCFFDGGVIGSEIFPGSAWHIDADRQVMLVGESLDSLRQAGVAEPSHAAQLHDFGYPHAPIVDLAIGALADRALFDTGSPDTIVLFERIAGERQVRRAMVEGSRREGRGSSGVSAAGLGPTSDLLRFEIENVRLGGEVLGRQPGTVRAAPPSLIGMGILGSFNVTLDYPGGQFLLHPRPVPSPRADDPGYALTPVGSEVRVTQLFAGSRAMQAGLRLGDSVTHIDGRALSPGDSPCETMRFLFEDRPTLTAQRLTVLRDGEPFEIVLADRPE